MSFLNVIANLECDECGVKFGVELDLSRDYKSCNPASMVIEHIKQDDNGIHLCEACYSIKGR